MTSGGSRVITMQARFFPWLDRSGRLSTLKLATFVGLFVPAAWIALSLDLGWFAPKPVTEAIHQTGFWAVRFLLLSLAVSPLRRIAQWNKLLSVRRMLGLAALAYGLAHLALYTVDQKLDLGRVASEIALRFYLTIGFVALLGLVALGVTSTDAMIRRLGSLNWTRLHTLVYAIAILGLLHFMIQSKVDITQPVMMLGFFLLLMGQRGLQRLKRGDSVPGLVALALAAPVVTALCEAAWYAVRNGIDPADVLGANLAFDDGPRPAWWVLVAGLALVALRLARRAWARAPPRARPVARAAE